MPVSPTLPVVPPESSNAWGTILNTAIQAIATFVNTLETTVAGIGYGADIYRAATGNTDTGTGTRTMTGYDTTRYADTGYTVSLAAGTITLPTDGTYLFEAHAKYSAQIGTFAYLAINDGSADVCRGPEMNATHTESSVTGFARLAAGTVVRATVFTSSVSASTVGDAGGHVYYLRVVRVG